MRKNARCLASRELLCIMRRGSKSSEISIVIVCDCALPILGACALFGPLSPPKEKKTTLLNWKRDVFCTAENLIMKMIEIAPLSLSPRDESEIFTQTLSPKWFFYSIYTMKYWIDDCVSYFTGHFILFKIDCEIGYLFSISGYFAESLKYILSSQISLLSVPTLSKFLKEQIVSSWK